MQDIPPTSIARLKEMRPQLFEAPDFWRSRNDQVSTAAARSKHAVKLGVSAGNRDIFAFQYGEFEPIQSTATISSAMASDRPGAFYDPDARQRPSLTLIGSIHGGETEGIALSLALIELMETGRDTFRRERRELVEKMRRVRLNIVPCLNPDGREAAAVSHLSGAEIADLYLVQQGIKADGTPFQGRQVKEIQPIPEGYLQFMGGYYNAEGVNLQHDDFFGPQIAPENAAIRNLFRKEIPDAFLTMHAHGALPAFLTPNAFLSPGTQRKQMEMAAYVCGRLQTKGLPFLTPDAIVTPPWSFYFQTWLAHMTGATPSLFEFCHGLTIHPMDLETILETGFAVFEGWLDFNLTFGPRPRSHALFGEVTKA